MIRHIFVWRFLSKDARSLEWTLPAWNDRMTFSNDRNKWFRIRFNWFDGASLNKQINITVLQKFKYMNKNNLAVRHPPPVCRLSFFFNLNRLPQFSSDLSDIWLECAKQYYQQICAMALWFYLWICYRCLIIKNRSKKLVHRHNRGTFMCV